VTISTIEPESDRIDGWPNGDHETTVVRHGEWAAHVDKNIAPLVLETWKAYVPTVSSCEDARRHFQDRPPGTWVLLGFTHVPAARRWLSIVAPHEKGGQSLYNRAMYFVPKGMDRARLRPVHWRWEVSVYDRSARHTKDEVEGLPAFDFYVFVYFLRDEVPILLDRLRAYNGSADASTASEDPGEAKPTAGLPAVQERVR